MKEQINAVQQMQKYIEEHLHETITLSDLSRVSFYSPWYCYRLFVKWINMSPAEYIRRLRLSKSALKLRDENYKVIDIAFELGFGSVDGYQRAFFKEFGCNPREYAQKPVPIYLFTPYMIEDFTNQKKEKNNMREVKSVFVQVIEKPERKVLIKRGISATEYFSYCDEVGCDVWGLLKSIKSISGEPVCLWLPKAYIKEGTSLYVQGVEVPLNYNGQIPEGFDIITLPTAKYLMFQGEAYLEEEYSQAITELQKAIDNYQPEAIGYEWDESNPRIQLEPIGTRGYIELKAIKNK